MGFAFTVLGWALAVVSGEVAVSCLVRLACARFRRPARVRSLDPHEGLTLASAGGTLLTALLTALGALPPWPGAVTAAALLAVSAFLALTPLVFASADDRGEALDDVTLSLAAVAHGAWAYLMEDLWMLTSRGRDRESPAAAPAGAAAGTPAAPVPASPAAAAAGGRRVPAPPKAAPPAAPPPAEPSVPPAGGAPLAVLLSPGWVGLCDEINGFEGDTDEEVLGFIAAQLAGHAAHAEKLRDLADRLMHGTGLDPAFAQGIATYADENADMAGSVTMLDRMFHAIYDALRAWADEHPMGMPHRAREFLQGDPPPLADDGDDGAAAA